MRTKRNAENENPKKQKKDRVRKQYASHKGRYGKSPKKLERRSIAVDGVFDIETEGWDRFVLGALYIPETEDVEYFDHTQEEDFVDRLLGFNGTVYGHNSGRYDTMWLLKHIVRRNISVDERSIVMSGPTIAGLRVGDLKISDSFKILEMSLEKAAEIGGVPKLETGFRCNFDKKVHGRHCTEDCGGYCQIKVGMSRANMSKLKEYLEGDCKATYAALDQLSQFAANHDLDLGMTIGSSAWRTAKRWLDLPDALWPKTSVYEWARRAYFGGRTQMFRTRAKAGYRYDINSAYPAALANTPLPCGDMSEMAREAASKAFSDGREGLYKATVKIPLDTFIPPLPVRGRMEKDDGRKSHGIAYPVGTFTGYWSRIELQHALDVGAKIEGVEYAVVWSRAEKVLEPFARQIWDLRFKAGKSTAFGKWLKFYVNSLTGKLAQNPEQERFKLNPASYEETAPCKRLGACALRCMGAPRCPRWLPILSRDPALFHKIWTKEIYEIASCAHLQWSAYLTSAARNELHRQLTDDCIGGLTSVYTDTDSCWTTCTRQGRIGDDLGEWLNEGRFYGFYAPAPKTYSAYDEQGQFIGKAKGIPDARKQEVWEALANGQPIQMTRGVDSFKQSARSGKFFSRKNMHRRIRPSLTYFGDRIIDGDVTRARDARELELVA